MAHWTPRRTSGPLAELAALGQPPPTAPASWRESAEERWRREQQMLTQQGGDADGYGLSEGNPAAATQGGFMGSIGNALGLAAEALGASANPGNVSVTDMSTMSPGAQAEAAAVAADVGMMADVGMGAPGGIGDSGSSAGTDAGGGTASGAGNPGGGWARGGPVTRGLSGSNPQGPDDGYGALDYGEFVMNAAMVKKHGMEAMQALNEGRASITMNGGGDVQQLARLGRGGDTELVHMTKDEVAGMQQVAEDNGASLTRNPETGLPEAWIMQALGIASSLYSGYKGRKQAKELGAQAQAADTWGQSGGRVLAGTQLQQLMQDPEQVSASDPGYRMRIQGAQRAMAPYGQDSGAMAVAAAGASSDWYNQRLAQLGGLAGAPGQPGVALQGQELANQQYRQSLGSYGFALDQAGRMFSNPGAGSTGDGGGGNAGTGMNTRNLPSTNYWRT